jgi:outer membrane protein TolC
MGDASREKGANAANDNLDNLEKYYRSKAIAIAIKVSVIEKAYHQIHRLCRLGNDCRLRELYRLYRCMPSMKHRLITILLICTTTFPTLPGCLAHAIHEADTSQIDHYQAVASKQEEPDVSAPSDPSLANTAAPRSILTTGPVNYWDMSLQEAMHYAITHSRVLLDLGGTVLRNQDSVSTTYTVAQQETDPQFGPEAALAAFDAQFSASLIAQHNDQEVNNQLVGNNGFYKQSNDVFQAELTEHTVTGSQFTLRHIIDFNQDNYLTNQFSTGNYDAIVEGEIRHPLLQGSGVEFNRIAGPGAHPGVYNGVLIARVKTDISAADFAIGLRDFVSNVENAYWDLYYAYRDLDIRIKARDEALETWRSINALHQSNRRGGEADKEAQAREQYFRFEADVQDSLAGHEVDGTRTNNGSSPGTFRGQPGVLTAERRLRLLMNLPATDNRLIRPSDEPSIAKVVFDWQKLSCQSLVGREELRRQRWVVKQRELELVASRNFLQPNLDLVGRYRFRGFGKDLLNPDDNASGQFNNAYQNLTSGEFQEWELGAEFTMPIGFRQAHAGVRNAEVKLSQARAVLRDQERQIISDLSEAVAQVDRAFVLMQTNINRSVAARDQLKALRAAYEADKVELFVVLDAQRRFAEALEAYYQSRVDYALSVRNVYYEDGSLLEYCNVSTAEGPWPAKAYKDAAELERLRGKPRSTDYVLRQPPIVSRGPVQQPALTPVDPGPNLVNPAAQKNGPMSENPPAAPAGAAKPQAKVDIKPRVVHAAAARGMPGHAAPTLESPKAPAPATTSETSEFRDKPGSAEINSAETIPSPSAEIGPNDVVPNVAPKATRLPEAGSLSPPALQLDYESPLHALGDRLQGDPCPVLHNWISDESGGGTVQPSSFNLPIEP